MNDPTPAQNRTESDGQPPEAPSGVGTAEGAREARYAEAIDVAACQCIEACAWVHGHSRELARAVLPLVDAEVAAAVSEAQAEVTKWRLFAHGETIRADAAEDWQNEIAERIPDSYDCDDAQEAIIARWLDDLTSGDPQRVAQATAEGEGS